VADSSGKWVIGSINYIDANSLTVAFSVGFAGTAYMN
jgi:hypothetical protein